MQNTLYIRSAMLTVFLATLVASRVALAVNEVESNDPYTQPQSLAIGSDGTATVSGSIDNSLHRDVDYYSFEGRAGDVVTIDIDGGMDANFNGVWTALAIFGPQVGGVPLPSTTLPLDLNYIASSVDPGSVSVQDARIDNFVLPADGTYIVSVSSMPGYLTTINTMFQTDVFPYSSGSYTLIISGVTPAAAPAPAPVPVADVQAIGIDILPGKRDLIWLSSASRHHSKRRHDADRRRDLAEAIRGHLKGGIPVALLSTDAFNALDVDQSQLYFGSTGEEHSLIRCNPHGVDVNHDGRPDLLCHFDVSKANFEPGDTEGIVTGKTNSGVEFEGKAFLKIISGKRDPDHDQDKRRHRR